MKKTSLILSIVILFVILYITIINFNNYAAINTFQANIIEIQNHSGFIERSGYLVKAIRVSTYTILVLLSGIFVGASVVNLFLQAQTEKLKAYQRELEKTSVSEDNQTSRVEVLEAKIKTLEKAFNTVIDERTKLEVQIQTLNTELDRINKKS